MKVTMQNVSGERQVIVDFYPGSSRYSPVQASGRALKDHRDQGLRKYEVDMVAQLLGFMQKDYWGGERLSDLCEFAAFKNRHSYEASVIEGGEFHLLITFESEEWLSSFGTGLFSLSTESYSVRDLIANRNIVQGEQFEVALFKAWTRAMEYRNDKHCGEVVGLPQLWQISVAAVTFAWQPPVDKPGGANLKPVLLYKVQES